MAEPAARRRPVVFIDASHVKIRDDAVSNRPINVALAVTTEGRREILGLGAAMTARSPDSEHVQRLLSRARTVLAAVVSRVWLQRALRKIR
ncbi:transposase, partial [Streptomyces sp. NPDC020681]|uniref:transposase n=1 Tax=Streptomyces sp. NPDC020681 TaxID=3365083 RepID=UPI0037888D9F